MASILIASFALPFLFAMWVCRRVAAQFALHGLLVGVVVAALVYLVVARGQPEPLLYKIAHGIELVGGLPGGLAARRLAGSNSIIRLLPDASSTGKLADQ